MPGAIHRISTCRFSDTDRLFFDANIWLFLYGRQHGPTDSHVRVYSAALKQILAADSHIFIDALVLSEVINRMARFPYNKMSASTRPQDFKFFRNSAAFKPIAKDIADTCRRILGQAMRIESEFSSIDIEVVLNGYETGRVDFNDFVLAELCRTRGLKFVTDDGDLKGLAVTILTENSRLLS